MQVMTAHTTQPLLVAVSGGVDSIVLLDMLIRTHKPLIVAHVNHGIREESGDDESFVRELAGRFGLPYLTTKLSLGSSASEDTARQARYKWLDLQRELCGASAVVTAHHQDDVLETMIINLVRGTGWRGLCSLRETNYRHRPLLSMSKAEIVAYALEHKLAWREDRTNESVKYLRNRIRFLVMPRLDGLQRQQLIELYTSQSDLRININSEVERVYDLYVDESALRRHPLIMMPDEVAYELLRAWLGEPLEQARMRDLLLFCKTARENTKWSLDGERFVAAKNNRLIVRASRD